MDSYNFTYKDVIKRHERMINRIEKWEIHALAIIMLVVTAFFTFSSFCFAYEEEDVEILFKANLEFTDNQNYFSYGNANIGYIEIEKGYIYTFYNGISNYDVMCAFSNEVPAVNVVYYNFFRTNRDSSYSFIADDNDYLFFEFQHDNRLHVTRRKIEGYDSAINDLVDNVGVSQLWDTFGNGIDYIYVVVIVAFGIFLIALAIRKISKGKSEI